MKKVIVLLVIILFINKISYSQKKDNSDLIAAGAGLLVAGVSTAVIIEQYKEYIELNATEYILTHYPNNSRISASLIDFDGIKLTDLSKTTCVTLKVTMSKNGDSTDKKYILMLFTTYGWINDFGVNEARVNYQLFDKNEWNKMLSTYVNLAIKNPKLKIANNTTVPIYISIYKDEYKENDTNFVSISNDNYTTSYFELKYYPISRLNLTNKGIEISDPSIQLKSDFVKINGDSYIINDYSDKFKIIFNEKTLGFFMKNTQTLSQLKRSTINKIHEYLNN